MNFQVIIDAINEDKVCKEICYKNFVKKFLHDGYINCRPFYKSSWSPKSKYSFEIFKKELKGNRVYNEDLSYNKQIKALITNILNLLLKNTNEYSNKIIIDFISEYIIDYIKNDSKICGNTAYLMPIKDQDYLRTVDIDIIHINTLPEYIKEVLNITAEHGHQLFYRGNTNINYILLPYIQRKEKWLKSEREFYYDVQRVCPNNFNTLCTHLDRLVEMQHYEVPTRLLDITSNALVALFFSAYDIKQTDKYEDGEVIIFSEDLRKIKYGSSDTISILSCLPAFDYDEQQNIAKEASYYSNKSVDSGEIFAFNDKEMVKRLLHEIKSEKPAFRPVINPGDLFKNIFVMPALLNNRIIKQSGAFIITGLVQEKAGDFVADNLNELRYRDPFDGIPVFAIDWNKKEKILDELNVCGINEATLFPELDKVAEYIKNHAITY